MRLKNYILLSIGAVVLFCLRASADEWVPLKDSMAVITTHSYSTRTTKLRFSYVGVPGFSISSLIRIFLISKEEMVEGPNIAVQDIQGGVGPLETGRKTKEHVFAVPDLDDCHFVLALQIDVGRDTQKMAKFIRSQIKDDVTTLEFEEGFQLIVRIMPIPEEDR